MKELSIVQLEVRLEMAAEADITINCNWVLPVNAISIP